MRPTAGFLPVPLAELHGYVGGPKKNKTSLNAAERGGVGEGQCQCLFSRPSTISSETGRLPVTTQLAAAARSVFVKVVFVTLSKL